MTRFYSFSTFTYVKLYRLTFFSLLQAYQQNYAVYAIIRYRLTLLAMHYHSTTVYYHSSEIDRYGQFGHSV